MRINNDIRLYVRKAVDKRAQPKRQEIVNELMKLKSSYNEKLEKKREIVKAKLNQICAVARTEIIEYAKTVDCKLELHDERDFVSPDGYDIDRYLVVNGCEKVDAVDKKLQAFDCMVNEVVEEILFKLSLGGDYDSIIKEINNIKF